MPPERESMVLSAVSQALEQPADRRSAFLDREIGRDSEARREAESIISYQTRSTIFLQSRPVRGFEAGEMVGRFRVIRLIGSGGMGDVYEAEDTQQAERRRRVALKTIRADFALDPELSAQFKQEIGLGQSITHRNVCRVFDLGMHTSPDGQQIIFLTMELLEGQTLAQKLKAGPMEPAEALPIIKQVAAALTAAHERNVVHRDLKPGNIMLVPSGKGDVPRAVVTDFGLAVEASDPHPAASLRRPSGTPDYMSPEQVQCGPVGCVSDIYSLAVVAYEMVTGCFPFDGTRAVYRMAERLRVAPLPLSVRRPGIKPDWSAELACALDRDVGKRYPTAESFVAALEAASEGEDDKETVALDHPAVASPPTKRTLRMAGTVLVVLAALAGWAARKQVPDWLHPLPVERRIAVLPFENLGNNEGERAFTDGVTQSLVSHLTELEPLQGKLSIVPSNEIHAKKVTTVDEAAINFGVTLVITGSVERTARGIHMIVNLVDARKVKQLRSRDFFVNPGEPAEMQEVVLRRAADLLQLEVQPQLTQKLATSAPASPAAYDFYLRGLGYLSKRDGEDNAITEFQLALKEDPKYALAHAGLCEAYWDKYENTKEHSWVDTAWGECRQAINLDARLARPHVALAILNTGTGRFEEAVSQANAAIAIDPGSDQAHTELAKALNFLGRKEEAEETLKHAIKLRPGNGLGYASLATFYFKHGRYKDAEEQYKHVISLVPDNPAGYTNLANAYFKEARYDEAEEMLKQSLRLKPTYQATSNLGYVLFAAGKYAASVPYFEEAARLQPKDYMVWGNLGDAYRWTPNSAAKALGAYGRAIQLTKEGLSVNPKDKKALSDQGIYRAKSGDVQGGLAACLAALGSSSGENSLFFNAAVVNEIAHRRKAALVYMARAVQAGYPPDEIERDPELSRLREDSGYLLRNPAKNQ